jgi:hypothetical protein
MKVLLTSAGVKKASIRNALLPDGSSVDTEAALREAIMNLRNTLSLLLSSSACGKDERALALEVLEWIDRK